MGASLLTNSTLRVALVIETEVVGEI